MTAHIASIAGLVIMFAVATLLPVNMGAVALVGAFVVGGLFVGMPASAVLAGFPGDLFVTLVGITYLFAIAQRNGTIDVLVHYGMRAVGGRAAAVPWVMFLVTAALTSVGAVSPGAVAIVAPIALRFSQRYGINPLLMGVMVIHGAQGGGFSPISIYGGITNQIVARSGLEVSPALLFFGSFFFNLAAATILYTLFGLRGGFAQPQTQTDALADERRLTLPRVLTLVGLVALGVGALMFELNVGFVALTIAVALAILFPQAQKGASDKIDWSTVLLICGVITYIGVLQKAGTVDWVGQGASHLGSPLLAALLLCIVAAVVSAFASSVAVLGATIPLAVPLLTGGQLDAAGVVVAIAISTTIVDTSPFSTNGAIVMANAPGDREKLLRHLLLYTGVVTTAGPLLAWLVFVVL
jgi:di/tricarboxylate transporter